MNALHNWNGSHLLLIPTADFGLILAITATHKALDMGMGKTLIGCVWGKAFRDTFAALKIFVICPVSLREEWKRTANRATGLTVASDTTKGKKEDQNLDMKICSWSKVPKDVNKSVPHFVVVCDEAHSMQSMQAARTNDVLNLVSGKRYVPLHFVA